MKEALEDLSSTMLWRTGEQITMSQRIIGLAFMAMLAGCNAPTSPPTAAPEPIALPAPVAEPEPATVPDETPAPAADEPKAHADDPAVVARLRKLIEEREALGTKVFQAG
ncbi:hypothetical protein E5C33_13650 [Stenotrophomonas maltophilia]|uniref:hypothetical protein n=1 Tax=Stenotrophomonas maltophilia TaxID=40324 RepID=UPI00107644CC|nr:hypothetical protein [Stenotrophomonas maltophilia]TFZ44679.1 hypothetical protein E5C33_13650 [Stenotrophomonas maltophilia]